MEKYRCITTITRSIHRPMRIDLDFGELFQDVNQYCVEDILSSVPFPTQVQMARHSSFICELLEGIWRRTKAYTTLWLDEWRSFFHTEDDLIFFVHLMLKNITELNITTCLPVFLLHMKELGIAYFPFVETCTINEHSTLILVDEYIAELRTILPKLRIMNLISTTNGRNLWKFDNLEELSLFDNHGREYEIDNDYVSRMCLGLQNLRVLDLRFLGNSKLDLSHIQYLRNLEELKCNLKPLQRAMHSILTLQKLKMLTVFFDGPPFPPIQAFDPHNPHINTNHQNTVDFFKILNGQAKRIIGLAMDNFFLELDYSWNTKLDIFKYNKLQTLAYCCVDFFDPVVSAFSQMQDLHTLSFRNYEHLTSNVVWEFIVNCRKLKHLDVCFCKRLDGDLLRRIFDLLRRRGKSMYIYYTCSGFEDELIKNSLYWFKEQQIITFSRDQPPKAEAGPSYVNRGFQFEFIPLEEINKDPNADANFKPLQRSVSELKRIFS